MNLNWMNLNELNEFDCADFNDVRRRIYPVPSLQDLFKTVNPEVILDFLKAAVLYRLLWRACDGLKH